MEIVLLIFGPIWPAGGWKGFELEVRKAVEPQNYAVMGQNSNRDNPKVVEELDRKTCDSRGTLLIISYVVALKGEGGTMWTLHVQAQLRTINERHP